MIDRFRGGYACPLAAAFVRELGVGAAPVRPARPLLPERNHVTAPLVVKSGPRRPPGPCRKAPPSPVRLGLRANLAQFLQQVTVNALVPARFRRAYPWAGPVVRCRK